MFGFGTRWADFGSAVVILAVWTAAHWRVSGLQRVEVNTMVRIPPPEFTIKFRARRFPKSVPASGDLVFTEADLAHALFVTGRAPGERVLYGMASVWEFLHRVAVVPSYVRRSPDGQLVRSRLAMDLDRSEKTLLSYALGQALTGIFCEQVLGAGYLMHVDRYSARYGVIFAAGRKRADLFGPIGDNPTALRWVVAEAKGRSNAMEPTLVGKLVDQKRSVKSIAGVVPLALGCVASFPPPARTLQVDSFDPPEDEPDSVDLNADLDAYALAYYEPFLLAVEAGEPSHELGEHLVSAHFGPFGMTVGLLRTVATLVREARVGSRDGLYEQVRAAVVQNADREPRLFLDGTVMQTSWSEAMRVADWEAEAGWR